MSFLNKPLLGSCLLLGALCPAPLVAGPLPVASVSPPQSDASGDLLTLEVLRSRPLTRHDADFPTPSQGLVLSKENCTSLQSLLNQFSAVTGETVMYSEETASLLGSRGTGLQGTLVVPPKDVYAVVQNILVANRIVLSDLRRENPRMLWVDSLDSNRRGSLRDRARFVPAEKLPSYARDSALMISTTVHLPNTDVRTMGNSMRQLVSDPNTLQLVPMPESRSVLVTGFGDAVNSLTGLLKAMDEQAAQHRALQQAQLAEENAESAGKQGNDGAPGK